MTDIYQTSNKVYDARRRDPNQTFLGEMFGMYGAGIEVTKLPSDLENEISEQNMSEDS